MRKPKVFANPIDKKIRNNQEAYESDANTIASINSSFNEPKPNYLYQKEKDYDHLTVNEKIDKLLNRNGYIFNVDVVIVTKDQKYNTKIAGKVNNHLITLDNQIIDINSIVDLEIKN